MRMVADVVVVDCLTVGSCLHSIPVKGNFTAQTFICIIFAFGNAIDCVIDLHYVWISGIICVATLIELVSVQVY